MSNFIDWNDKPISMPTKPQASTNPCIALYGEGPEGKQCKDCSQIVGICHSKTFYKSRLRKITNGKATDHKLRWQACAKFEERHGDMPLYDGR